MLLSRALGICLLCLPLGICTQAQTASQPSPQESSSRTEPEQAPAPPDAPLPDRGAMPSSPSDSRTKRVLNKLDPHCIDVIFHACWSSPQIEPDKPLPEGEALANKDIEVGYYYLKQKNYVAAESRLKEAVELQSDAAAAFIGLGQAQQKLGKTADARKSYEAYLNLGPQGQEAGKVKKALAELLVVSRQLPELWLSVLSYQFSTVALNRWRPWCTSHSLD